MSQMPVINDNEMMAQFAKNLWENYIKFKYDEISKSNVSFYMATVVAKNNDGTLSVQEPFDNVKTVTCAANLRTVEVGAKVMVLKLGNGHNAANNLAFMDGSTSLILADTWTMRDKVYTNANSYTDTGIYFLTAGEGAAMSNLPVTITSNASILFVVRDVSTGAIWQMFTFIGINDNNASELWVRTCVNDTWRAWLIIGEPNTTPTWTAPTYTSSRGTTSYGGYYKVGRRVHVQLVCTWKGTNGNTTASGNNISFITNFPHSVSYAALSCINRTKGHAQIGCWAENSNNSIRLCWPSGALATDDELIITGSYIAGS